MRHYHFQVKAVGCLPDTDMVFASFQSAKDTLVDTLATAAEGGTRFIAVDVDRGDEIMVYREQGEHSTYRYLVFPCKLSICGWNEEVEAR